MPAKRIRVSSDDTTYYTLPGNQGEKTTEVATVNDTIYGQTFESNDTSLGQWSITANGIFKNVAGYLVTIKKSGSPTSMTDEATTLVSGKTYQITSAAKRAIDLATALTVKDGSTDVTAQVESIDYLNGLVTFKSSYSVSGAITVTGAYLPLSTLAKGRSFNLTQNAAEIDDTVYETAQSNSGNRTFDPGLRSVSLEVGGVYDATNANLAAIYARQIMIIEIAPKGDANTFFRGYFKYNRQSQSGDVGALEEENLTFGLYVPDGDLVAKPFSWYINNSSTLNMAIQKVLAAWAAETPIYVQYLENGTTGTQGQAIVTEASLANALDGLNEFSFTFRGSGVQTAVT
jgi:hypothetical protein